MANASSWESYVAIRMIVEHENPSLKDRQGGGKKGLLHGSPVCDTCCGYAIDRPWVLGRSSPPVLELNRQIGGFGRGERDSPSLTQQSVTFLLVNRTPPREPVERTA